MISFFLAILFSVILMADVGVAHNFRKTKQRKTLILHRGLMFKSGR